MAEPFRLLAFNVLMDNTDDHEIHWHDIHS